MKIEEFSNLSGKLHMFLWNNFPNCTPKQHAHNLRICFTRALDDLMHFRKMPNTKAAATLATCLFDELRKRQNYVDEECISLFDEYYYYVKYSAECTCKDCKYYDMGYCFKRGTLRNREHKICVDGFVLKKILNK